MQAPVKQPFVFGRTRPTKHSPMHLATASLLVTFHAIIRSSRRPAARRLLLLEAWQTTSMNTAGRLSRLRLEQVRSYAILRIPLSELRQEHMPSATNQPLNLMAVLPCAGMKSLPLARQRLLLQPPYLRLLLALCALDALLKGKKEENALQQ